MMDDGVMESCSILSESVFGDHDRYVALGTLVEGSPQMPDTSEVLCMREDLLRRTGFFDSAIWRWDPPGLQARSPFTLLLGHQSSAMS